MKWKITAQFLIVLGLTVIFSFVCFFIINAYFVFKSYINQDERVVSARTFSLNFEDYVTKDLVINDEGLSELTKRQAWVQILDENGTEIFNKYKPTHVPSHYTPGEIVASQMYTGTIKGNAIFVVKSEINNKLTYVIGFPGEEIEKYVFVYNPKTIFKEVFTILIVSLSIVLIIFTFLGYFFSVRMSRPMLRVIDGIQQLARGNFTKFENKGLYKDVFGSLNQLSNALKVNEKERKKTEQMREEWIANVTHDLNTPLSSVKGYAEVLTDSDYDLSMDERVKYAGIILNKSQYMEQLIEDLKLTYQLKASNSNVIKEEANLVDSIREVIIGILNHPEYDKSNINFDTNAETILFSYDKKLFQRAFANLIYNAIIHNPKGTAIHINVIKEGGRGITIKITDNGQGISKVDLARLFERYYRGTNTGENVKGSGLGMAIAKQIFEIHGGTIEVASEIGAGTIIVIRF